MEGLHNRIFSTEACRRLAVPLTAYKKLSAPLC
jgi:hypothetical protein